MNRLAILDSVAVKIGAHLAAAAPLEQGCFCLLREGRGVQGTRYLVSDVMLPPEDGWEIQARDQLRPSARWLSAVISQAVQHNAGLLFIHSHPDPRHPPGFSPTDRSASAALADAIAPIIDGAFAVAIVHPEGGWTAAIPHNGRLVPVERVAAIGRTLRLLSAPVGSGSAAPPLASLDDRQRDALGVVHDRLRALEVAVVGSGGLGSPLAEQLVRMGVASVTLIDPDLLDTASNVRRVFGSTSADLRATRPPAKVDVVGRHLEGLLLEVPVRRVSSDVRYEKVFRKLLDSDVVLCATDTHGSRAAVNDLASTYLLPVIDVGVRVGAKKDGRLAALPAEVRVLTPVTPCLWCRSALSSDVIRAENLPPDQRSRLFAEGYLIGWNGEPAPSVIALTVLGSAIGTCAFISLLSEEGEVAPSGFIVDTFLGYLMETQPTEPRPDCRCRRHLGRGDSAPPPLLRSG